MVKKKQSSDWLEILTGGGHEGTLLSKGNILYFGRGLDYTSVYIGQNSICTIKFTISLNVNWMSKKEKSIINKYWTLVNDAHTEVLRGKVYWHLQFNSKGIHRSNMVR